MSRYAEGTEVSTSRSRDEIERILTRYGATGFMYAWEGQRAVIGFHAAGRRLRFGLPLPSEGDDVVKWRKGRYGRLLRPEGQRKTALEAETRRRWRCLCLAIKAKLEAVETGISTFEEEFLAHIVLPDGSTFGAWAVPQIARAYESHAMPPMLPGGKE